MRLAVTRSIERLSFLEAKARDRRVELIALPLTRIEKIGFDWPGDLSLDQIDWLAFSSANGVRSFFERLAELGLGVASNTQIAVVGQRTAEALDQACGRKADFIPHDSYGELMFHELAESYPLAGKTLLYPRAALVNYDPEQFLVGMKVNYNQLLSYRSIPREVGAGLINRLDASDYILFTSPSNVRSYQSQFGRPKAKLIAMGRSTAQSMNEAGWTGCAIMKVKDIDAVMELI